MQNGGVSVQYGDRNAGEALGASYGGELINIPQPFAGFIDTCMQHLDQAEVYLSHDPGPLPNESVEAFVRRLQNIGNAAESLDTQRIQELCALAQKRIETLCTSEGLPESEVEILGTVLQYLRGFLRCALIQEQGNCLPPPLAEFLDRSQDILRHSLDVESGADQDDGQGAGILRGLRILIADDEEIVRVFLADLLGNGNHLCMAVDNGEEAIAGLETGLFDLVFTDLNMPGVPGLDVLKRARELQHDTEVVIITGYASVQNATDAVRFGAYDYLTKPFSGNADIQAVVRRVKSHLDLKRENHRLMLSLRRRNEELKRYAASLEDALEAVEEKQRALLHADRMATLGGLSAGVAHEINNPTTFIRGNLQTLAKFWELLKPLAERAADTPEGGRLRFVIEEMPSLIQDMTIGTARISKIVSALRSFSHQGGSHERAETDMNRCIQDALGLVHNRIKNNVEVSTDLAESLPVLRADAQQMTQVLVNLFINAADAMEGQPNATLEILSESAGNEVHIAVRDNGPGIPPEVREKIFDPFFTTKGVGKGTGLGLSILMGIVRDHGGRVKVETDPERGGTVFHLYFPPDGVARPEAILPHVLIVDDNRENAEVMRAAVHAAGEYTVDVAFSAKAGLEKIRAHPPRIIVLDVVMPEMDGFEFIEKLRSLPYGQDADIIATTGLDSGGMKDRLLEAGVCQVFFKPFRMKSFLEAIDRITATREGAS